jgi:pyridoxamine 5'-phosphate oxidase family protein
MTPEQRTIDVGRHNLASAKKYRDVERTGRVAFVIEDIVSTDLWHVRGIEIRGQAETIPDPAPPIRVYPERVVAWGLGDRIIGKRDSPTVCRG